MPQEDGDRAEDAVTKLLLAFFVAAFVVGMLFAILSLLSGAGILSLPLTGRGDL